MQADEEYVALLRRARHPELTADRMVEAMSIWFRDPGPIGQQPYFAKRAAWKRLAEWLTEHRHQLSTESKRALLNIPFVPTQNANFASIVGDGTKLKFPPRHVDADGGYRDVLPVDNIIDLTMLSSAVRELLKELARIMHE
jgi:hypothetical protein